MTLNEKRNFLEEEEMMFQIEKDKRNGKCILFSVNYISEKNRKRKVKKHNNQKRIMVQPLKTTNTKDNDNHVI